MRVEVLPSTDGLAAQFDSPDPVVRAAVVDLLRARRAGGPTEFTAALADPDHRVRIEAVRALVSLDDWPAVAAGAGDANREVRVAVAHGLATVGIGGLDTVRTLTADRDPLVRAASLAAFAEFSVDADDHATLEAALGDSAWQVREGAARGLAGVDAVLATPTLAAALADPHLDVRKAAVLSLAQRPDYPPAHDALQRALDDRDADVRAYARRAVATEAAHPRSVPRPGTVPSRA